MKKILMVIALTAIVLAVAPQVQAQDMAKLQALQTELEQIQARANARGGSFTPQEVQRMNDIQNEMMQAAGIGGMGMGGMSPLEQQYNQMGQQLEQQGRQQEQQALQQERQREQERIAEYTREHTGGNRGWPAARAYSQFNIGSLKQPSGTTASYSSGSQTITIYLHNAKPNTMQELKTQIEAITRGKTLEHNYTTDSGDWHVGIHNHFDSYPWSLGFALEQKYDIVTLIISRYTNQ